MAAPDLTLPAESVEAWQEQELQLFHLTLAKRHQVELEGSGSRLNDELFTKFSSLCRQHNVEPDHATLAGLLPSVRSALGNTCERLLNAYGQRAVAVEASGPGLSATVPDTGRLVAYRVGADFGAAISELRQAARRCEALRARVERAKVRPPKSASAIEAADQRATELLGSDEYLSTRIAEVASEFFYLPETVRDLVANPKQKVSYPDSVSVFENEVRVAQHKLSGETDVNNTAANIEIVLKQATYFCHLGRPVVAMAILPFSKPGVQARWQQGLERQRADFTDVAATAVSADECVFTSLFGDCADQIGEYENILRLVSTLGANRLFRAFAPEGLSTDGLTWTDVRPKPVPPTSGRSSVTLITQGMSDEAIAEVLALAAMYGAVVDPG